MRTMPETSPWFLAADPDDPDVHYADPETPGYSFCGKRLREYAVSVDVVQKVANAMAAAAPDDPEDPRCIACQATVRFGAPPPVPPSSRRTDN